MSARDLGGHRLRPRRLRMGELGLMGAARACHETLGPLVAAVEDVSLQGMGLVVPGAADGAWFVSGGDPLTGLAVYCGGAPIYRGTATIRHATPQGGDLVVGMELDSNFIDLRSEEHTSELQSLRHIVC